MKQLTREQMKNITGGDPDPLTPAGDECRIKYCTRDSDCANCDNNKCKTSGALTWCQY